MEPRSPTPRANIIIETPQWRASLPHIERDVHRALRMVSRHSNEISHSCPPPTFVFSDDQHVQKLNSRFRGKNKPTNVLTFEPLSPQHGGDIIFGFRTIKREALSSGKSLQTHLTHLLIHGLLHLEGHDHLHPGEARRMEQLESLILRRMGLPDPWKQGARRRS